MTTVYGDPFPLPWSVIDVSHATADWRLVTGAEPRLRKEWDYHPESGSGHYAVVFTPQRNGPCRVVVVAADGSRGFSRSNVSISEAKTLADAWVAARTSGQW